MCVKALEWPGMGVIAQSALKLHLGFDLKQFLENLDDVNPGVKLILTSARRGRGVANGAPG